MAFNDVRIQKKETMNMAFMHDLVPQTAVRRNNLQSTTRDD